jgi:ribosomal protein S3AE
VSLADLNNDPEQGFRKIQLKVEDIAVSRESPFDGVARGRRRCVRSTKEATCAGACRGHRVVVVAEPR